MNRTLLDHRRQAWKAHICLSGHHTWAQSQERQLPRAKTKGTQVAGRQDRMLGPTGNVCSSGLDPFLWSTPHFVGMCTHAHTHTHIYIHIHIKAESHAIHMHIHIITCIHVDMHTCGNCHVHTCSHITPLYAWLYMYTHLHAHMCTHSHRHMHAHTQE